ncbi:MAG: Hsp20/alpha crystallin family protein [Candidatus Eremiobacteraeota bacterium]|nr:Hsp20/alpha crystallin family protein [Candidatus Eremiobacteraeota bacterium]MBV8223551.1 Hsp20/alpha crystallin family protein [Candidatus Eremiobacteraeota bacterium]
MTTTLKEQEPRLPAPRGLFDTFFGPDFPRWPFPELQTFRQMAYPSIPQTDVYEKDGKYYVEIALPGFKKDDITLEVAENQLTISAAIREPMKEAQRYHFREMRRESYLRTIVFPCDINAELIDAVYENGILKVVLPPVKPVEAKKVAIKG